MRSLLALPLALLLAAPASAATYDVTTEDDGPGCTPGACTLRGALAAAAGTGETDTVNVPAGRYALTLDELDVPGGVTIVGAGADRTTVASPGSFRTVRALAGPASHISGLTISGGQATMGAEITGGNVLTEQGASLTLDQVRVTGGTAYRGGGIATTGGGRLEIRRSLIDGNEARVGGQSPIGDGGGILLASSDPDQRLVVTDTTIAFNTALRGAGLATVQHPNTRTRLERVTIADNAATAATGGGLLVLDPRQVEIQGSILARNTGNFSQGSPLIGPSNCGAVPPVSFGGNVESGTDCGLEVQGTTAGLEPALVAGLGPTPVLPIPWTSAAHDVAGPCAGTDQRGVARPQGNGCDAGAFETQAPPPPTVTPSPTPGPPPARDLAPVANRTIVAEPVSGTVRVRAAGTRAFTPLTDAQPVAVGATIDTRDGGVRLTVSTRAGAPPRSATFAGGLFKVTQSRGITTLKLTEALAPCATRERQRRPRSRSLTGQGGSAFRISGRYSSATGGTRWLVRDSCSGTLTRVTEGRVKVRHGRRTIVVAAGTRYLARPRR